MLDADEIESLMKARAAELQRLSDILRAIRRGGSVSADNEAWAAERLVDRRGGIDEILTGAVPVSVVRQVLGVTQRSLQTYTAEGMPREARNAYNLAAVVQWWGKWRESKARGREGRGALEARRLKAQARKLETETEILTRRYWPRDFVLRCVERSIVEARGTLKNLPAHVGAVVPANLRGEVSERVREIVESALKSLAEGKRPPMEVAQDAGGPGAM